MELYFQNARHKLDISCSDVAVVVFVLADPGFQVLSLRKVAFEDRMVEMKVGDFVNIPPNKKQRVDWTTPNEPTVWLAMWYGDHR